MPSGASARLELLDLLLWQSGALKSHHEPSEAIRSHQKQSHLLELLDLLLGQLSEDAEEAADVGVGRVAPELRCRV